MASVVGAVLHPGSQPTMATSKAQAQAPRLSLGCRENLIMSAEDGGIYAPCQCPKIGNRGVRHGGRKDGRCRDEQSGCRRASLARFIDSKGDLAEKEFLRKLDEVATEFPPPENEPKPGCLVHMSVSSRELKRPGSVIALKLS